MADRPPKTSLTDDPAARPKAAATRDARLKAALRANIARRKARDRALSDDPTGGPGPDDIPEKD